MSKVKLMITGAKGRMGQAVAYCAREFSEIAVTARVDIGDDWKAALASCDTVIDFTRHQFTSDLVEEALKNKARLVIGTTGHTAHELKLIKEASRSIPIVHAPNFSVGVNTLFWLTRRAAEILGPSFDLEVVETHHRMKTDSPSGTARRLAEILADVAKLDYGADVRHGRHGDVGARTAREIGMHAVRGGDVVGDHTVIFAAQGERVELTHKASSRDTFATGALRAAVWLADKTSGLHDMQDVLSLR